ncbi:MAG TPA: VWA domain-containing protein [Sedimentisphaerales bacterium]|nr:VWA domain-containing protein [Phycisphaerae bacterium]HON93367.1 VWA domain-containing protein [Sedimentisphaerales bacterium]HOV77702.1 VWA domain-containing protein [Sedimentisphaerales bacterium]
MMEWHSPWALLLLLILPFLGYLMVRKKRSATVRFASLVDMRNCPVSWRLRLRPVLVVARLLCVALLILALARPRKGTTLSEISTEGIAIEAVVDRSGSMKAEMDYYGEKLDRLEVVKRVLTDFIEGDKKGFGGRRGDLIGLVTFARYADTVCPLVLSHGALIEFLKQTQIVSLRSEDGTAIGDAIALGAARLKKAEEELQRRNVKLGFGADGPDFTIKNKILLLLTDGRNNMGRHDPLEAAELAGKWGIKIYCIGIGSAQSYQTVQTLLGTFRVPTEQDLDEGLLKAIAEKTGGFYSRADDAQSLRKIVETIDKLEKTEVKTVQFTQYNEHFGRWTLPALALLGFEILAGCTIFRKIP